MLTTDESFGIENLEEEVGRVVSGGHLDDPYRILRAAREAAAVFPLTSGVLVARYNDVLAVIGDQDRYSNETFIRGSRAMEVRDSFSPEGRKTWQALADIERNHITRAPRDRHEVRRAAVHRYFTPRRILAMQDVIQAFVDELLVGAEQEEVFDQKRLAAELALRVMSYIIGSPQVDRDFLRRTIEVRARGVGAADEQIVAEAYAAHLELDAYVREVIMAEHRRDEDPSELARSLMEAEDEATLSSDEVVGAILNMIIGGLHTTAALLTIGMVDLLEHRDQWEVLCADPGVATSAVEELLRYTSPVQLSQRIALEDMTWDGIDIPAETTIVVALGAANRDPRVIEDPETLDVRSRRPHLGLGHGVHYCLGASVLRNEARILLTTLATRYPNVELAIERKDIDWSAGNANMRSVRTLPTKLGPRRT